MSEKRVLEFVDVFGWLKIVEFVSWYESCVDGEAHLVAHLAHEVMHVVRVFEEEHRCEIAHRNRVLNVLDKILILNVYLDKNSN